MKTTSFAHKAILAVAAAVVSCYSFGLAATTQVSVTGNVVGDCSTIPSSGTLAFGSYSPFSASDTTTAVPFTLTFNCTKGDTNLNVAVSGGQNYTHANPSGSRAMKDATNNYLTYQLYQTSGTASPWAFNTGSGVGTTVSLTAGGVNTANTVNLYGVIPNGQTSGASAPDVGSYSDQVTITVNY